jgi:signal transduction histidine kinase
MLVEGDYGKIPAKINDVVKQVFEASNRMARLVDVFLNVSRIEAGRLKLELNGFDLNELVYRSVKDLEINANERGLKLNFKKDNEVYIVRADSDKIKDVLLNLIDNAIKYTKKGSIDVKLSKKDSQALVEVSDTGVGLEGEDIDKLFNKFSRGEDSAKINTGGSGLGLYVAKKIIDAHGGKIWVESLGKEKGSKFSFTLPLSDV